MLNAIWLGMIFLSVIVAICQGRVDLLVQSVTQSAKSGFEIALGLTGILALWLGIMAVASESGLVNRLAKLLNPLLQPLFPDIPKGDKAMGAIVFNIAANMLGLGNAATPFGLQAMKELQRLNQNAREASNAMCTFLAINTSSVQLIPATAIAFLIANDSHDPGIVIITSLFATACSTIVALVVVKNLEKWPYFNKNKTEKTPGIQGAEGEL